MEPEREYGVCLDCGERSELRLPRRFPHICTACLFPPPPKQVQNTVGPKEMRGPSLIEALHHAAAKGGKGGFMRNELHWSE